MALYPLNPGVMPIGQMDCQDADAAAVKGGEVMTLTQLAVAQATDKHAFDDDGYLFDASGTIQNRVVSLRASAATNFPLYLSDDGTANYGTYFGQVIGTPTGITTTGTNLGPHTAAASGKVTLWDKPGRYAVTVDSLATDFISTIPSTGLFPGEVLGFCNSTDIGKVAHNACSLKVAGTGVAYFVEFKPRPGLVNTPVYLVSSTASATPSTLYDRIELDFHAGAGQRTLN